MFFQFNRVSLIVPTKEKKVVAFILAHRLTELYMITNSMTPSDLQSSKINLQNTTIIIVESNKKRKKILQKFIKLN